MKILFFLLFLTHSSTIICQTGNPIKEVIRAIKVTKDYDAQKWSRIKSLRNTLHHTDSSNLSKRYTLNLKLLNEFKVFKQDSAFAYGIKVKQLAIELDNQELIEKANIKLAEINISAGMYKEGLEFLQTINSVKLSVVARAEYYELMGRYYNELADYSNLSFYTKKYNKIGLDYRKSAIDLINDDTFKKQFLLGIVAYDQGNFSHSLNILSNLSKQKLNLRETALVHSVIGFINEFLRKEEKAIRHFSIASIADIKSSTKETLATTALARLLYKKGETKKASIIIQKANDDAEFFGAQQRKIEVGAILPLIEEQIVGQIEYQKEKLYKQNIIMTILIVFLVGLSLVILTQVNRLKKVKKILSKAHIKLQEVNKELLFSNNQIALKNKQLKNLNHKLLESNKIKEEYLGLFFTQDALIFQKFKEFKTKIDIDLLEKNFDRLAYTVKGLNLKCEKERILKNFDEAFIQLFPNFIEEFNSLLLKKEQIQLKKGQILNKELRIFALMRLGIKRHEIIALILDFNVNSVYTYKTRIRKKSTLNSKEFDHKLFQNTSLKL